MLVAISHCPVPYIFDHGLAELGAITLQFLAGPGCDPFIHFGLMPSHAPIGHEDRAREQALAHQIPDRGVGQSDLPPELPLANQAPAVCGHGICLRSKMYGDIYPDRFGIDWGITKVFFWLIPLAVGKGMQ